MKKYLHFALCYGVGWAIVHVPGYAIGLIGLITKNSTLLTIFGVWYAILWMPWMPENIVIVIPIALWLQKRWFPQDKELREKLEKKIIEFKEKRLIKMIKKYNKLFLIYVYTQLGESNVKMFDEIAKKTKNKFEWDFQKHTENENNAFLEKWKKENKIKLTDYKTIEEIGYQTDKNGVPIIISKKSAVIN